MKFFFETTKITEEEARANLGAGNWGVSLGPKEEGNMVAWEAPMLGNGGADKDINVLPYLLASYNTEADFDPMDGPDEILYRCGEDYYHVTITAE